MTDLTEISVISTAESALKKLKKAEIQVFNCKKRGALCLFSVKTKDIEKVFAIFDKPCYNVKVKRESKLQKFQSFLTRRAGLVAGFVLFVALAFISNLYCLKIEVAGSGKYLETEVRRIVLEEGAGEFKSFSSLNVSSATGRILALPQVTFCNIEKRGSVLIVDVEVNEEHSERAELKPLISDCDGKVKNIVAVCGTQGVSVGDSVKKGDILIYASTLAGENTIECLACGYAEIECAKCTEFFAEEESEENLKKALASVLIDGEEILSRKVTVKPTEGGIIYLIDFTYIHKLSINLS